MGKKKKNEPTEADLDRVDVENVYKEAIATGQKKIVVDDEMLWKFMCMEEYIARSLYADELPELRGVFRGIPVVCEQVDIEKFRRYIRQAIESIS